MTKNDLFVIIVGVICILTLMGMTVSETIRADALQARAGELLTLNNDLTAALASTTKGVNTCFAISSATEGWLKELINQTSTQ